MRNDNWETYMYWLLEAVGVCDKDLARYSKLWDLLHNIGFVYKIPRDDNRMYDGLDLRKDFGCEIDERVHPCGVLEVLVALAIRMENDYFGTPGEEKPGVLFWIFIENLGLKWFHNRRFNEFEATRIVYDWLNRKFMRNGCGSICPMKKSRRDMREVEIWDQVIAYFSENREKLM